MSILQIKKLNLGWFGNLSKVTSWGDVGAWLVDSGAGSSPNTQPTLPAPLKGQVRPDKQAEPHHPPSLPHTNIS